MKFSCLVLCLFFEVDGNGLMDGGVMWLCVSVFLCCWFYRIDVVVVFGGNFLCWCFRVLILCSGVLCLCVSLSCVFSVFCVCLNDCGSCEMCFCSVCVLFRNWLCMCCFVGLCVMCCFFFLICSSRWFVDNCGIGL